MRHFRFCLIATAFVLTVAVGAPSASASGGDFKTWLNGVRAEARQNGISEKIISQALYDGLAPIPKIIALDRKQPEKTIGFQEYYQKIVNADRIQKGRTLLQQHKHELDAISKKYGVQPEVIVALWGIETNFGQNTGGYLVVDALATLAYDGRRSKYFRGELMNALKILNEGHIEPKNMKGSWAGAMGQCQFMPSSFLTFAVDHTGDGHKDIWNTKQDVFASAANYLSRSGWHDFAPIVHEVKLPKNFDSKMIGLEVKKPLYTWARMGVTSAGGEKLDSTALTMTSLVQPKGSQGRTFAVYDNYRTIMRWNNSTYFATSVGLLANSIALAVN